jgi:hypothetical protein
MNLSVNLEAKDDELALARLAAATFQVGEKTLQRKVKQDETKLEEMRKNLKNAWQALVRLEEVLRKEREVRRTITLSSIGNTLRMFTFFFVYRLGSKLRTKPKKQSLCCKRSPLNWKSRCRRWQRRKRGTVSCRGMWIRL